MHRLRRQLPLAGKSANWRGEAYFLASTCFPKGGGYGERAFESTRKPLPLQEGDFHRISGIGQGIEKRLHAAGITTFNQLASLSAEEIVGLLNGMVGMKVETVTQKDWIGQARQYAQELGKNVETIEVEEPAEHQHYESYMIELLLDEEHNVRRTRITHVKSGEKDGWAGWEPGRLDRWITSKANLHRNEGTPSENPVQEESPSHQMSETFQMRGVLQITDIITINMEDEHASRFLDAELPFKVQIELDLSEVNISRGYPLQYQAKAIARRLGSSKWGELGQAQGHFIADERVTITLLVSGLPEGTYRLEIFALVAPQGAASVEGAGLQAISEGKVIQMLATAVGVSAKA